jgi:Lrp/AsnC family transcriptional regulator for asnA, asnC and gidA
MNKRPELDELDKQILKLLQSDGRMPYTAMSKILNVSEATARKRATRLISEGYIKIYGVLTPSSLGFSASAIVGVRTEGGNVENIVETLKQWDFVRFIAACTGTYDLILEVVLPSNEELFTFLSKILRAIPGVVGSDTSLIMRVYKERFSWSSKE